MPHTDTHEGKKTMKVKGDLLEDEWRGQKRVKGGDNMTKVYWYGNFIMNPSPPHTHYSA